MKLDIKTKRGKLIVFGALASLAVVAIVVAVPAALLAPQSSSTGSQDVPADDPQEVELREFLAKYPGTIDRSGDKVAVNADAFADNKNLPADFALPTLVTAVRAGAFKGAKLPRGFALHDNVTSVDPAAFDEADISNDDWWDNYPVAAGARIVAVEDSADYKEFDALYPGKLEKRAVKGFAFQNRKDLPEDFSLPAFVNFIGSGAFSGSVVPAGFTLPSGVQQMEFGAFYQVVLPAGFTVPKGMSEIGIINNQGSNSFAGSFLPDGFKIPATVKRIFWAAFYDARAPVGFSIPSSVEIGNFVDGKWVTNSNSYLSEVRIPDGSRWNNADNRGFAGATVVLKADYVAPAQ